MYKAAAVAFLGLSAFMSSSLQVTLRNVTTDWFKLFEVKIFQYKSNKSDVYLKVKLNTLVFLRPQCRDGSSSFSLLWSTQTSLMTEQVMWMNVLE